MSKSLKMCFQYLWNFEQEQGLKSNKGHMADKNKNAPLHMVQEMRPALVAFETT